MSYMKTLEALKAELLADGIIDAEEVVKLKEVLYDDGVIDKVVVVQRLHVFFGDGDNIDSAVGWVLH